MLTRYKDTYKPKNQFARRRLRPLGYFEPQVALLPRTARFKEMMDEYMRLPVGQYPKDFWQEETDKAIKSVPEHTQDASTFHISVWNANLATAAAALQDLTSIADSQLTRTNNNLSVLPSHKFDVIAAYHSGATATRAVLNSPKFSNVQQPLIQPINLTLLPVNNPAVWDLRDNPIVLDSNRPIGAQAATSLACGMEQTHVGMWLRYRHVPAPRGDLYCIRATGTTTHLVRTWGLLTMTFDSQIDVGEYSVIGGNHFSATSIFWRLVADGYYYRPGGLGFATLGLRAHNAQYMGGYGEWCRFLNTSLPRLEGYSNAADTANTLFLQVVKTR